jgi:peptide/nickel transport system substrate-binding protein
MSEFSGFGDTSRRGFLQAGASGLLAASSAGLLAACGSSSTTKSGATVPSANGFSAGPAVGTPVRGGTLTAGMVTAGSAETIDTRKLLNFPDLVRSYNLLDPMFFAAPGGGVAPGLVVDASSSTDAKVWKFKLRDGVVWHDGKPFDADDIVYTIRASWFSKVSNFLPLAKTIVDLNGVRKLDRLTVEIPLLLGVAQFPSVTFAQNAWVIQNGTTNFSNGVGTGPFKLQSFTPGSQSVFTANKDYWQSGMPYIDTLIINSSYADDDARLNALLAGDLQIVSTVPPALAKANAQSGRIVLGNEPGPAFVAPSMRVDKAPFTDPRVTQAMKLVANRQAAVSDAFDGYATPGNDCPCATVQYFASDIKPEYDPEKARSLLKAAGHEGLALTLYTADIVPGMNETATLYAQQAKQAGINITVQIVNPSIYYSAASPGGNYTDKLFSINNWTTGTNSLAAFYLQALYTGCPYDETHFGSPSADKLLFDAMGETNPSLAAQKWHAVQELQVTQGGYVVMENFDWIDAYAPNVRGIQTTEVGPCNYWDFNRAWLT